MVYELWGDDAPVTALRTLRSHVSRLRRVLPCPEQLITRRPGYTLEVAANSIDAAVFERLADRARRDLDRDTHSAADSAAAALGLWRGRALDDLLGFEFAEREARRLEERRVSATELRLDADLRLGRHDHVLPELRALVVDHPFYERFLGVCAVLAGEPEAGSLLEDARERLRLIGDDNCLITAVGWLGVVRERNGRSDAAACYAEAARVSRKIHHKPGLAMSFDRIARLAYRSGRTSSAVRLAGAVHSAVEGISLAPYYLAEHRALIEEIGEGELPTGGEDLEELVPYALEVAAELTGQG
ncbi:MAG: hypothetical protein OEY62_06720, partial [Acidimicrobiia bacterium]|nr:hypothetical protein [Acidimicrobiia bacterium]